MRFGLSQRYSRTLAGLLFALALSFASISPSIAQESDQDIAVQFVREWQVNRNFKDLMTRVAIVTTTFQIGVKEHGPQQAFRKLSGELDRSVIKFGEEWDQRLAKAYLTVFSADELESLRREKKSSPYVEKFVSTMDEVGIAMRADAQPLLQLALKEAMLRYFEWVFNKSNEKK